MRMSRSASLVKKRKVEDSVKAFKNDSGELDVEGKSVGNEQLVLQLNESHADIAIIVEG